MKAMESLQDLIEEAKVRTVWWAFLIFAVSYFLTNTSKSMWMNIPIAILLVSALRILSTEVEFRWKVRREGRPQTYLSHLEKKQLSLDDPCLSAARPPPRWKRTIDSPVVEAAIDDFIGKIMQDFVVDLWYSEITPDREAPELIRAVIMDALTEISGRVKELNLVNLLTRDVVDIIGDHIDLFRRNQAAIGVDVMGTLSSEERDDRLKHHLMASKELHPALVSPDCEYKVLQQLIGGVIAVVLRPREAQCPLVRCIARELVTCLVMQPIMDFASPAFINELIEYILLALDDYGTKDMVGDQAQASDHHHDHSVPAGGIQGHESTARKISSAGTDMTLVKYDNPIQGDIFRGSETSHKEAKQPQPADWVRVMEAATQRRTEILAPENLENMWTKGRNYKKKGQKIAKSLTPGSVAKDSGVTYHPYIRDLGKDRPGIPKGKEDKALSTLTADLNLDAQINCVDKNKTGFSGDLWKQQSLEEGRLVDKLESHHLFADNENKSRLKRSNSTSALKADNDTRISEGGGLVISENFYSPNLVRHDEEHRSKGASDIVTHSEELHLPKLRCRVIGAYFEKIGSKSFAVYSIAVTDAENATWFVKRRYRNFERLHRHLKDIPNYTLHLPPKRIFSSSTEDAFVHQRCIQLDKYLQDLLSIANVAEQHEVWDFLSVSSKNYSFGKSPSVMKTLAVNVDDAVDDIVRQFKGVSGGLMRKVAGPSSSPYEESPTISSRNLSWHSDEMNKLVLGQNMASTNSFSDNEEGDKDGNIEHREEELIALANGWHSDNELSSKSFPPRVVKREEFPSFKSEKKSNSAVKSDLIHSDGFLSGSLPVASDHLEDPMGMPPEWTPPKVSVPMLNLVDKIFQLKRRGWLRRQVFWISKQILQLMMDDAIDDWLLRQVHWLRREDIIAQGIRWIQDALWPNGTFFKQLSITKSNIDDTEFHQRPVQTTSLAGSKASTSGSFEQQLEAARRASYVKKMLFEGAPTTLVSLIGHKQYKRCAKDIYYFSQSTTCVKQLAYGVLELLIISVFPELRDLVVDVHKQMRGKPV